MAEALGVTTDFLLGRATEAAAAGDEIMALFREVGNASAADQDFIRDILKARRKKGA